MAEKAEIVNPALAGFPQKYGPCEIPLLSQEGWREAPGWFQSDILQECGLGTTPRGIRFAIPLPAFLDGCGLPGLHSLRS